MHNSLNDEIIQESWGCEQDLGKHFVDKPGDPHVCRNSMAAPAPMSNPSVCLTRRGQKTNRHIRASLIQGKFGQRWLDASI